MTPPDGVRRRCSRGRRPPLERHREAASRGRLDPDPGESKTIVFELPVSGLTIVTADCRRVVERGDLRAKIGGSSREADLKSVLFKVE